MEILGIIDVFKVYTYCKDKLYEGRKQVNSSENE
jgi:hypothetical protein